MSPNLDRKLIDTVARTAYNYTMEYHGCSQCILKALQEHLKLGNGDAFKAASALAGGIARMGETCGALLGGIMAIGLAFGRDKLEDSTVSLPYATAMTYAAKLYDRFQADWGSTKCWSIQESLFGRHFNLKDPEERTQYITAGGHQKCSEVVRKATALAAEIILTAKAEVSSK